MINYTCWANEFCQQGMRNAKAASRSRLWRIPNLLAARGMLALSVKCMKKAEEQAPDNVVKVRFKEGKR